MPLLVSGTMPSLSVSSFRLHWTYACCLNAFINHTFRNTCEDVPPFTLTAIFFWQLFWWGWGTEKIQYCKFHVMYIIFTFTGESKDETCLSWPNLKGPCQLPCDCWPPKVIKMVKKSDFSSSLPENIYYKSANRTNFKKMHLEEHQNNR